MTKDRDEKDVIRARMAKTGESYAAARAQLARESDTSATPPEERSGDQDPGPRSIVTTPASGAAIEQSEGPESSAWHLLLALGAGNGVAARVLAGLGLPSGLTAPPVALGSAAAGTWQQAFEESLDLAVRYRRGSLESGFLLRAAVAVLRGEHVPAAQRDLLAALKQADLETLCKQAWQEHGAEGDARPAGEGVGSGGLFGRFTDRARAVVADAHSEARGLGHTWIGTEHLLLGLLADGGGVAAQSLTSGGAELTDLRDRVVAIIGEPEGSPEGQTHIPFTPGAKTVLELSVEESTALGHNYVGTEHLLLALISQGEGVATTALEQAGLNTDLLRDRVFTLLAGDPPEAPQ